MRLRWAKTLTVGQCLACMLVALCLYIYILLVHDLFYKYVVLACLQIVSGLIMCQLHIFCKFCILLAASCSVFIIQSAASQVQISFSRPPAGCKFLSVGHQPDANCIRRAAMQYKIPKFINSLHVARDQLNEILQKYVSNKK